MNPTGIRKLIVTAALALLVLTMSTDVLAQGRNRRANGNFGKKCAKFVNCHDARDGRWDGRGPNRQTRFSNNFRRQRRYRDRDFDRISRRDRFRRDRDWQHNRWRRLR